jgi:hypothetical protein
VNGLRCTATHPLASYRPPSLRSLFSSTPPLQTIRTPPTDPGSYNTAIKAAGSAHQADVAFEVSSGLKVTRLAEMRAAPPRASTP